MTYLNSKKQLDKLLYTIGHEHVLGGISKETLDLAIQLAKSIEADEAKLKAIKEKQKVS